MGKLFLSGGKEQEQEGEKRLPGFPKLEETHGRQNQKSRMDNFPPQAAWGIVQRPVLVWFMLGIPRNWTVGHLTYHTEASVSVFGDLWWFLSGRDIAWPFYFLLSLLIAQLVEFHANGEDARFSVTILVDLGRGSASRWHFVFHCGPKSTKPKLAVKSFHYGHSSKRWLKVVNSLWPHPRK